MTTIRSLFECRRCKAADLSADSFYASNSYVCKECVKARVREHRKANVDAIRAYDRKRSTLKHRVANNARVTSRFRAEYPKAYHAHSLVKNAIRDGVIERQPCEQCGAKAFAHHDDYDKPLHLRWLCQIHHVAWHQANGPGANKEGPAPTGRRMSFMPKPNLEESP